MSYEEPSSQRGGEAQLRSVLFALASTARWGLPFSPSSQLLPPSLILPRPRPPMRRPLKS